MHRVSVIDSHTEGEPTRVVVAGGPDLGGGSVAEKAAAFREKFDWFRSAVCNEPRGSDPLVGALLVPASNPRAACGVIFFNNVGTLNACGHGTIGLGVSLAHLGRIGPGTHLVETPVGEVSMTLGAQGEVSIDNVPAFRHAKDVEVAFQWQGRPQRVRGDVAWGGNWFFLVSGHDLRLDVSNVEALTDFSWALRKTLEHSGITGDPRLGGGVIDHVELFGPPGDPANQSRNFVLCPGKAYDRSPCGTGTSAKLACLAADGVLAPGAIWRQESIIGSVFAASYRMDQSRLIPTIRGRAFVTAEATVLLDPRDPFVHGIRTSATGEPA